MKSTHRELFQGLCEQHVAKHRPAVLGHLGLLAGSAGSGGGLGISSTALLWAVLRGPDLGRQEHRMGVGGRDMGRRAWGPETVWRARVKAGIAGGGQYRQKMGQGRE